MIEINKLEDLDQYYDKDLDALKFMKDGDRLAVKINIDLNVQYSIIAGDLVALDITAHEIIADNITANIIKSFSIIAESISAKDIVSFTIYAYDISANDIIYTDLCYADQSILCNSISSTSDKSNCITRYGDLVIQSRIDNQLSDKSAIIDYWKDIRQECINARSSSPVVNKTYQRQALMCTKTIELLNKLS